MRVFLAGQKSFGREVAVLVEGLGLELAGISCPVDSSDRLYKWCRAWERPVIPAGTLTHRNLPDGIDLIVAAHSHDFIGKKTRQKTTLGAVGYHPSLLPRHRGRSAVEWAVRDHDPITGGTVFWLSNGVDCGPIAAQDWCWIRPDDTAHTLWRRELFPLGLQLLEKVLVDARHQVLIKVPQDPVLATWEPGFVQPSLYRPDLPELSDGRVSGYRTVVEATGAALSRSIEGQPNFVDAAGISDEDLIGACEIGVPVWPRGG